MTAKIGPLAITNLQRKAREYCQAIDALLELDVQLDEGQIRRLLATLQSAESTTRELIDRLREVCVDSGWLERMSETKRTEPRMKRLPTNDVILRDPFACVTCGAVEASMYRTEDGKNQCGKCLSSLDTRAMDRP